MQLKGFHVFVKMVTENIEYLNKSALKVIHDN